MWAKDFSGNLLFATVKVYLLWRCINVKTSTHSVGKIAKKQS